MTIPEILSEIEKQTGGLLKKNSFFNLPCPHPTCSVCSYIYKSEERTIVLTELFDVNHYMEYIVNRAVPGLEITPEMEQMFDTFSSVFAETVQGKTGKTTCPSCSMSFPRLGEFVDNITYISVHAFIRRFSVKEGSMTSSMRLIVMQSRSLLREWTNCYTVGSS
ncbi:MAG: hypothetical protein ACNYVW_10885 [Methanosarcinales archaeon]